MVVVVETISRVVENKQLFGVRQSMCHRHTETTLQYASIQMQGWTRIACKAASEQKKKAQGCFDRHAQTGDWSYSSGKLETIGNWYVVFDSGLRYREARVSRNKHRSSLSGW